MRPEEIGDSKMEAVELLDYYAAHAPESIKLEGPKSIYRWALEMLDERHGAIRQAVSDLEYRQLADKVNSIDRRLRDNGGKTSLEVWREKREREEGLRSLREEDCTLHDEIFGKGNGGLYRYNQKTNVLTYFDRSKVLTFLDHADNCELKFCHFPPEEWDRLKIEADMEAENPYHVVHGFATLYPDEDIQEYLEEIEYLRDNSNPGIFTEDSLQEKATNSQKEGEI